MMLSVCVEVEDIDWAQQPSRRPGRKRTEAFEWPTESFYYKGISEGPEPGAERLYGVPAGVGVLSAHRVYG